MVPGDLRVQLIPHRFPDQNVAITPEHERSPRQNVPCGFSCPKTTTEPNVTEAISFRRGVLRSPAAMFSFRATQLQGQRSGSVWKESHVRSCTCVNFAGRRLRRGFQRCPPSVPYRPCPADASLATCLRARTRRTDNFAATLQVACRNRFSPITVRSPTACE